MDATVNISSNVLRPMDDPPRRVSALADATSATARRMENRRTIGQFVGSVFYSTLLSQMQASTLKSPLFHGGRGEDAFAGQLALELGKRIGQSATNPLSGGLIASVARRLARNDAATPPATLSIPEGVK